LAGKWGLPVHDDVPLPSLTLIQVVKHRDAAWRLHNSPETTPEHASEFGQSAGQKQRS
jgi:hypothetical protein